MVEISLSRSRAALGPIVTGPATCQGQASVAALDVVAVCRDFSDSMLFPEEDMELCPVYPTGTCVAMHWGLS